MFSEENKKSEPFSYREKVRIFIVWCHNASSNSRIQEVVNWFAASPEHNIIYTYHNEKQNKDVYMVALRDADGTLIGYYEKHEFRSPETMERYAF